MSWTYHDREDAAQEVELNLLKPSAPKIDAPDRYKKRATRHSLCEFSRREARRRDRERKYAEQRAILRDPKLDSPECNCEREESSKCLRDLIAKLPTQQRSVIEHVCILEIPVHQAAMQLGKTAAALNSALFHGRRKLERALKSIWIDQ